MAKTIKWITYRLLLAARFCFLMPAMTSSSVDADVRISAGSKSSMSKLTGSRPCTLIPLLIWDYDKGNLRHCIELRSSQLVSSILHNQNNTTGTGDVICKWSSQLPQEHFMLCGTWQLLQAHSMKLAAVCWYIKHAWFVPKISLPHQQLLQPLLHPHTFQGTLISHVPSGLQGIFRSAAWQCLWTCDITTQQGHAAFPFLCWRCPWTFDTLGSQDLRWSNSGKAACRAECIASEVLVSLILQHCTMLSNRTSIDTIISSTCARSRLLIAGSCNCPTLGFGYQKSSSASAAMGC